MKKDPSVHDMARITKERSSKSREKKWLEVLFYRLIIWLSSLSFVLLFVDVVVQQLDNQVDVSENHTSAAVAFATELVECVWSRNTLFVNEIEVAVPFVAHNLKFYLNNFEAYFAAGEASNRNDHFDLIYCVNFAGRR